MKKYLYQNRQNIFIILVFFSLPFIFFDGVSHLNSIILGMRDAQVGFFPAHDLKLQVIKNLELPLWDRYIFSGYPMLSTPSDSALYPINLVLGLIFPLLLSYNLSVLLHYSLAGIFLFFFMREYELDKLSCFVSGLIFMFSGIMITNRDHVTRIWTIIWIPLILLLLEKFRKTKRFEFLLLASIPYAISFFAGDPQLFLYSSMIILFFILYYSLIYEGLKNYFFLSSFSVFLLGFLLISVQLIPVYIMMQNSFRDEISYSFFTEFSFNPKYHPLLFFPFLFGRGSFVIQGIPEYFGEGNAGEIMKYFGISTIPLMISGIFKRNRHKYLWLFVLIFSLFLVFGKHTGFYRYMFDVPLYNKFRVPARNWFEFGLAFSILAGFGFDLIIKMEKRLKIILISAVSFIFAILLKFIIFFITFRIAVNRGADKFLSYRGDEFKYLIENLNLANYSIYIPLIVIIITIGLFTLLIFKRNKIIFYFLIVFIFLDLFSMGHFMDRPRNITYLNNKIEDSSDFKFLNEDEQLYRIFSESSGNKYHFSPNKNIHYSIESISGHDPLLLRSYGTVTSFPSDPDSGINEIKLLKNNIIISMLNTKYIFLQKPQNEEELLKKIEKNYYISIKTLFSFHDYFLKNNIYASNLTRDNELTLSDTKSNLEIFKFPVELEENKKYLVSFSIKSDKNLKNTVSFDFFGAGYDSKAQEFNLLPEDIEIDYGQVQKTIETGSVPDNQELVFRIFTNSSGNLWIKDLTIREVEINKDKNYSPIFRNEDIIVLKNLKYLPRFYFVKEIIEVNNINEVSDILWEKENSGFQAFDPKVTALIEDPGLKERGFTLTDSEIKVISYSNNSVKLDVFNKNDGFLVFSDNYYPGWEAYLDNNKTVIYRTNGILKGIFVPKGNHKIIFKYLPSYFRILLPVSLITLLGILALSCFLYLRDRNKKVLNK